MGESALLSEIQLFTHFPPPPSRAQGEVSIREALRELEMWGAGCAFSLTPYTDSTEKEMNIIRDWKELVNQVSVYHNPPPYTPVTQ